MLIRFKMYKLTIKIIKKIGDWLAHFLEEDLKGDLWEFRNDLLDQKKPKLTAELVTLSRAFELVWATFKIALAEKKESLWNAIKNGLYQDNTNHSMYNSQHCKNYKSNAYEEFYLLDSSESPTQNLQVLSTSKNELNEGIFKKIKSMTCNNIKTPNSLMFMLITCLLAIINNCGYFVNFLLKCKEILHTNNIQRPADIHKASLTLEPEIAQAITLPPNLQREKVEVKQKEAEVKQKEAELRQRKAEVRQKEAEIQQRDSEARYWLKMAKDERENAAYWLNKAQNFKTIAKKL